MLQTWKNEEGDIEFVMSIAVECEKIGYYFTKTKGLRKKPQERYAITYRLAFASVNR